MSNFKLVFKYAFKDLGKQKVRSIVGILGVMISVGLLAIVLFLSDSISVTYIDYMAIDAGNADMKISVRHYQNEPEDRSNYFEFNPVIDSIRANFDEIGNFVPRMDLWGNVNISENFESPLLTNQRTSAFISGINFTLENEINFGAFVITLFRLILLPCIVTSKNPLSCSASLQLSCNGDPTYITLVDIH